MDLMKAIGMAALAVIAVLMIVAAIMFSMRYFSSFVTTITVEQVAPGVSCAKMVTADGAAISCWRDAQ
ncbi:MAG: hypothetical protein Q8L60_10765 [Gammaproteobacteria bacterium]|nr:hypothetical protein [Gammaproteobacteria bacterium]MDP2346829.1 hypothetical protein [Gammaproteobacteria bacterium]